MPNLDLLQPLDLNFFGYVWQPDGFELVAYTLIALFLIIVIKVLSILATLFINKYVARSSRHFPRHYRPTSLHNAKRILIAGDSTAVGTGASSSADTLAGRLAHDFPNAEIINVAKNGARSSTIIKQLVPFAKDYFDMVLISTGGNDMLYVGNLPKVVEKLGEALELAQTISRRHTLLLLYSTNVGALLPLPIGKLINHNRHEVQEALRSLCEKKQVPCIELFTNEYSYDNPFYAENYHKLLASDHIHPNSEGYRVWYLRLWRSMAEHGYELTPHPKKQSIHPPYA
jgi:lysophospholipase L1-like esterase